MSSICQASPPFVPLGVMAAIRCRGLRSPGRGQRGDERKRACKDAADAEFEAALCGAIYDAFVIGEPMSDVMLVGRVSRGTVGRRIKEMI